MQIKTYNQKAEELKKTSLPEEIFGLEINQDLIYQVVVAEQANQRRTLAHVKDRSAVRGGGRKPWPQKGTGRARHGSTRSPIWIGGGVTFGPSNLRNFTRKINKKMKKKALFTALSSKVRGGQLFLLDKLAIKEAKTRELAEIINNFKKVQEDFQRSVLLILPENDKAIVQAGKNISRLEVVQADSLNALKILSYKYILMPKGAIAKIEKIFLGKEDGNR